VPETGLSGEKPLRRMGLAIPRIFIRAGLDPLRLFTTFLAQENDLLFRIIVV
jgi:hypothetical protein